MLIIRDLSITTREILLYSLNITLEKGTVYGLSGRNGSGKTTLLRTISGIRSETEGSVLIQEDNKISLTETKQKLFYYETVEWLDPNLSGWDYLQFVQDAWKNKQFLSCQEIVDFWEMNSYIKLPIKKYSLGMKQKVLLSMYGVSGADYWILDEPTIGLDKDSLDLFGDFIRLARKKGKCILFSSHQNDSIYSVCDFVFEIQDRSLNLIHHKKMED